MTKAELQKELDEIIQGNKHTIKLDYFVPNKLAKLLKEIDSSINLSDDLKLMVGIMIFGYHLSTETQNLFLQGLGIMGIIIFIEIKDKNDY